MKAKDRRQDILELLVEKETVQLEELIARYDVSRMTLHRDLEELVDEGWATRIRGGITVVSDTQFESDFRFRQHVNVSQKTRIAAAAAALVSDGDAISLGYGSTVARMLPLLEGRKELTVATASMPILQGLSEARNIELLVAGGKYLRRFDGFFGRMAERAFADLMVDTCFLSTSALRFPDVYHQDQRVVQMKMAMLENAQRRVLLMDRDKIGRTALYRMGRMELFDTLITDQPLSEADADFAEALDVEVIVAPD